MIILISTTSWDYIDIYYNGNYNKEELDKDNNNEFTFLTLEQALPIKVLYKCGRNLNNLGSANFPKSLTQSVFKSHFWQNYE